MATSRVVDDELEAQLAALRREKQDQADEAARFADAQRQRHDLALRLGMQFADEMLKRGAQPLPLFSEHVHMTMGRKKSILAPEKPRIWRTTYKIVEYGWPIGKVYEDYDAPAGYLKEPAVTTRGKLVDCEWATCFPGERRGTNHNRDADYGVRTIHVYEPHPQMLTTQTAGGGLKFLRYKTEAPFTLLVDPRSVAEAIHHYAG